MSEPGRRAVCVPQAAWRACRTLTILLLLSLIGRDVSAATTLRGIAVEERLEAEPLFATPPPSIPFLVRLTVDEQAFRGPDRDRSLARLDARLALHAGHNTPVVIALGPFPATDAEVDPWREIVRLLAERARGRVAGYQVGDAADGQPPDADRYGYLLKIAAVQIRAADPDALVLQGRVQAASVEWQTRVYATGVGPYEDGVAVSGPPGGADDESFRAEVGRMAALVDHEDPTALIVLGPIPLDDRVERAKAQLVDAELRALGTRMQVNSYNGARASLEAAFVAGATLSDLLSGDLVTLDEATAGLRMTDGGVAVLSRLPHRLLYNLTAFDTYLVYWGVGAASPSLEVEVNVANVTAPMVRDPSRGSVDKPAGFVAVDPGKRLRLTVPAADRPLIIDFNYGAADTYVLTTEAQKPALPRVEEIIFRHQQAQTAQNAALQHYVAHVRIEQHFHISAADPEYNVVTENRLFSDKSGVEWEELSFALNGAKWTANRPPFPLLQPEKVLSMPLDLRLNRDYTYRLERLETVGGREAFVIRFEPADETQALYRGTVWIDRQSFVRLKIQAVQTKLSGMVMSNDETQLSAMAGEINGRPIWLADHLSSKQIFLIAGRNVLVEREVRVSDFQLNGSEFDRMRTEARAGSRIMYRDTDQGVRYFVKEGENRVVSNQMTSSVRALAFGADFDPSLVFPLPIGGIDIVDFNFLRRDMQLALLFGGVIAFGNIQHPKLWGGRFDASVDFFGLAVRSMDSVFDSQGEREGERVDKRPVAAGFNLGYQVTPFHKVSGHYEFNYDWYVPDPTTSPDFVLPSSTATHGEGIAYEFRRRGYSLVAKGMAYQRTTWEPWGLGGSFDPAARTFTRYDIGVSKDFVKATFHTIHLNGTYFGGTRLDRFSMYQFGLFAPTRMHGVPTAVRFGELAMFRGSYSFNLFDVYRLDLSVDHARGRDPQGDGVWQPVTGFGVRLNLRAPRSTLLQLDVGKSLLPDLYKGAGSTVIQILLLKPL